jgi:hypothetical protein
LAIAAVATQNGGAQTTSATSITSAYGSNVTAGSLIVLVGLKAVGGSVDDAFVSGDVTKSAGTATIGTINFATSAHGDTGGGNYASSGIWWAIVTGTGSMTWQLDSTAASALTIARHEFTGSWDASSLEDEVSVADPTNTASLATGNGVSAGAALFVAGAVSIHGGDVTITQDAAFTTIYENETVASGVIGNSCYQTVGSGTTDEGAWTTGASGFGYAASLAVFKEAAAGGATIVNRESTRRGVTRGVLRGV